MPPRSPAMNRSLTSLCLSGWLPKAPAPSMASLQFPDADWLSLDCIQTGHCDFPHAVPNWFSTSSYLPVRKMYANATPAGTPRPVIDLEPHYESTHHAFDVSSAGMRSTTAGTRFDIVCLTLIVEPTSLGSGRHPERGLPSCQSFLTMPRDSNAS